MQVGRLLNDIATASVPDQYVINHIGHNRLQVTCNSANSANQLIELPCLKEKQFIAYIPSYCLQKKGIIRNVDADISEEVILSKLKSSVKVLSVQRIYRKTFNETDGTIMTPLQTVIITFDGISLPSHVSLFFLQDGSCSVCPASNAMFPVFTFWSFPKVLQG